MFRNFLLKGIAKTLELAIFTPSLNFICKHKQAHGDGRTRREKSDHANKM